MYKKLLVTVLPYTTEFRHYGKIKVPVGTVLTNKTAMGIDPNYRFVNEYDFLKEQFPDFHQLIRTDMENYGVNVPKEFTNEESKPIFTDAIKNVLHKKFLTVLYFAADTAIPVIVKGELMGSISPDEDEIRMHITNAERNVYTTLIRRNSSFRYLIWLGDVNPDIDQNVVIKGDYTSVKDREASFMVQAIASVPNKEPLLYQF